jgi:hypothetical protein
MNTSHSDSLISGERCRATYRIRGRGGLHVLASRMLWSAFERFAQSIFIQFHWLSHRGPRLAVRVWILISTAGWSLPAVRFNQIFTYEHFCYDAKERRSMVDRRNSYISYWRNIGRVCRHYPLCGRVQPLATADILKKRASGRWLMFPTSVKR